MTDHQTVERVLIALYTAGIFNSMPKGGDDFHQWATRVVRITLKTLEEKK